MLADNGGRSGNATLLQDSSTFDLRVQGGAALVPSYSAYWYNSLLVASNSWLIITNLNQLVVSHDTIVLEGGGISADGGGYAGGLGNGGGYSATSRSGGGGYGGYGALNTAGRGYAYGSIPSPVERGSGGGNGSGTSAAPYGGSGGGIARVNITGTLTLDGTLSANGLAGARNSGGGSGGSVWLTVGTLSGNGFISANGGAGDLSSGSGGGGGGRVAIQCATNLFTGNVSAYGGAGGVAGGAGTIYLKPNNQSIGQVIVDNGGQYGTNTAVNNFGVYDLTVRGGAAVFPSSTYLILSNLFVRTDSVFLSNPVQTNLQLVVLSNVVIEAGAAMSVNGQGFPQGTGPGAGYSGTDYSGSGAGYGGYGGDSATAPGGTNYGSATQPVDQGSGGGFGSGPVYGSGSQGGGAIRLSVGGNLMVDGWLSANGTDGWQDNSGGGSGGSIWVNARTIFGSGYIMADGGYGELYNGGGGSGGRIAIYHLRNNYRTNTFTGFISAYGGDGYWWGDDGTIFLSSNVDGLQAVGHSPDGTLNYAFNTLEFTFNQAVNPFSASGADLVLSTPNGVVAESSITVSSTDPNTLRFVFPVQTAVGAYAFTLGPQIEDLYGQPMVLPYTGAFAVSLPVIAGTVTDLDGQPVRGVLLQPSNGYSPATTDADGNYALGFVPDTSFTVVPSFTNYIVAPASRSYSGLFTSISNENYVVVTTIAPVLSGGVQGTNLLLSWQGIPGVTYSVHYSTNLVDWYLYGDPISGSNTVMQLLVPIEGDPAKFFRIDANNY